MPPAAAGLFRVQYLEALGSAWQTLNSPVTIIEGTARFEEATAPPTASRFYRIVEF